MSNNETLIICFLLAVLGLIVVGGVIWFGFIVTKQQDSKGVFLVHESMDLLLRLGGGGGVL